MFKKPHCLLTVAILLIGGIQCAQGAEEAKRIAKIRVRFFSESAMLYDRGISLSPFLSSIDRLIAEEILEHENFRECFNLSLSQARDIIEQVRSRGHEERNVESEAWLDVSLRPDEQRRYREILDEVLTATQQRLLIAVICLNREGLMALRRDIYEPLLGLTLEQRIQIGQNAEALWNGKARTIDRQRFVLQRDEIDLDVPLRMDLRRLSRDLDVSIAGELTDAQIEVLAILVDACEEIVIGKPQLAPGKIWSNDMFDVEAIREHIKRLESQLTVKVGPPLGEDCDLARDSFSISIGLRPTSDGR